MKFLRLLVLCFSFCMTLVAAPLKPPLEFYDRLPKLDGQLGYYPLISDTAFRAISNFIIDQSTELFDPDWVRQGDIIYLNIWFLPWFEKYVHDQIKFPYVLITCDVGSWLPDTGPVKRLLYDPKLAAWFCRNMLFSYHPKLFQIPIGQHSYFFDNPTTRETMNYLLKLSLNKPLNKKYNLYMNHYPRTYGDRDKIVKLFENAPYCYSRNHSDREFCHLSREEFYDELVLSQFVISPIGLETDCLRTWEAVILNCIPVIEHTFLDPLYEDLPIALIHEWQEVNEEFLHEKYEQLKNLKCDKAYFEYWYRLIAEMQSKIRRKDLSFAQLEATQFSPQDLQDLKSIFKENSGAQMTLLCKGFLTTVRPLQIVQSLPFFSKIYLYDPWLSPEMLNAFDVYLTDRSLLKYKDKVVLMANEQQFNGIVKSFHAYPIFLDLTYHRHSLLCDFNNFRHSLKKDIHDLYQQRRPGAMICGNMAQNDYVREVLAQFSFENDVLIETKGNFWFFKK